MSCSKKASQTILDDAAEITEGERQKFYGKPVDNHGNTAELWAAYLRRKHNIRVPLTPRDVCLMMVLLKVSRDANKPNRDNLVDIAGYARNAEMVDPVEVDFLKDIHEGVKAAQASEQSEAINALRVAWIEAEKAQDHSRHQLKRDYDDAVRIHASKKEG